MNLCAGQCRYLLSIYRLQNQKDRIRCVDVARDLGVTRPSVSKMMKCMVRMELIEPDYCENVILTAQGREIAETFNADYELVYAFFRKILRLTPIESKEQAFLFLSTFPETTVKRLCSSTSKTLMHVKKKRQS